MVQKDGAGSLRQENMTKGSSNSWRRFHLAREGPEEGRERGPEMVPSSFGLSRFLISQIHEPFLEVMFSH